MDYEPEDEDRDFSPNPDMTGFGVVIASESQSRQGFLSFGSELTNSRHFHCPLFTYVL